MTKRTVIATTVKLTLLLMTALDVHASEEEPELGPYNAWQSDDSKGCNYEGEKYEFGHLLAMNLDELEAYKANTGYRASDGYAVLMVCTYLVDPLAGDHPVVDERDYKWVAFSW
ncbi:hypothetical protein [Vibrio splendidus]|uniref:hypothetical protein n=1 Tax=Vibrio splendidus TaxID=29497 RepID=UPI003D14492C